MNLNIKQIDAILKKHAHCAHAGINEPWTDLTYECLGGNLTIGFDKDENKFDISLAIKEEEAKSSYDPLSDSQECRLEEIIDHMVEQSLEAIMIKEMKLYGRNLDNW